MNSPPMNAKWMLILTLALVSAIRFASGETFTAPLPTAETPSSDYQLEVNGTAVPVYTAKCNKPELGDAYSFAIFDFTSRADLKVTTAIPLDKVEVRPREWNIRPKVSERTASFTLNVPRKISFEPAGRKNPLLIFAGKPESEIVSKETANVIYFGPGIHKPENGKIVLKSNQILYLARGAILKAAVESVEARDIRILGRGIIDGSDWAWQKGPSASLMSFIRCNNVQIEGITIRGSYAWTIVPIACDNVTIRNVNIVNGRVQNDDGINPCNSQHVTIENCFIRTDDDCIALKGLDGHDRKNVHDININDCVFWCDRARVLLMGHESQTEEMSGITLRDCSIIHYSMTAILLEPGENMLISDVMFRRLTIDSDGQSDLMRLHPTVNEYMKLKTPGRIRNVTFRDSSINDAKSIGITIEGADADHTVENVTLHNITLNGHNIAEQDVKVGAYASDVTVKRGGR
jgi:polygalacturonase